MKAKLLLLFAVVLIAAAAVPTVHAASVTTCPPGTTNRSYCETSQLPNASVSFVNGVAVIHTKSGLVIDTGSIISCLPHLALTCGGSVDVTANVGNAARVAVVAHGGWHVKSGKTLRLRVHVVRKYAKLFTHLKKITLLVKINSHGSATGRKVTLTKHATMRFRAGATK